MASPSIPPWPLRPSPRVPGEMARLPDLFSLPISLSSVLLVLTDPFSAADARRQWSSGDLQWAAPPPSGPRYRGAPAEPPRASRRPRQRPRSSVPRRRWSRPHPVEHLPCSSTSSATLAPHHPPGPTYRWQWVRPRSVRKSPSPQIYSFCLLAPAILSSEPAALVMLFS
jgi:hypothetical protein